MECPKTAKQQSKQNIDYVEIKTVFILSGDLNLLLYAMIIL